ncbi:MAG: alpha-ketoacid dehydrogenase subunit beta [Elusimicrobia bacterium]|nr:alpha-ketoacid dehydrogenase subunit beta [Elusimicrobiota bacterium]MDE2426878.1 alpha-ketoacid dehydrogenase subunit beta [Elusimicrobiota bacterium]
MTVTAAATRELNLVQAVNEALDLALAADERVLILGEDVGRNGGVFRATEGLWKKYGEQRVVDTPLAEIGIVGGAIGLALAGLRPVAEIQFDGFMPAALDQVICHLGRLRSRTRGRRSVPLVLRAPHGGLIRAPEHHSESPEAYFCHTPGIKVVIASTPYDAKGLLLAAIDDPDPVVFFEPKRLYRAARSQVPRGDYRVELGKARLAREGRELTLIGWGAMVQTCLEAAELLAGEGRSIEVLDLRTLTPLDLPALLASVEKTGRAVIAHEAPNAGSWAAELSALISERALLSLQAPVRRVGGWDIRMPLFRLEDYYVPDRERVADAARQTLAF